MPGKIEAVQLNHAFHAHAIHICTLFPLVNDQFAFNGILCPIFFCVCVSVCVVKLLLATLPGVKTNGKIRLINI